jgi:hypothetical protein
MPSPAAPVTTERVDALVGEYLAEKRREDTAARRALGSKQRWSILTSVLVVLCVAAWIAPSFVQPAGAPPSPARVEAGARMSLFLASERIRAFHRKHGRLPGTLSDAGVDSVGIGYVPVTNAGFELWTDATGSRIRYRSSMGPAEFLGATFNILTTAP